VSGGLVIAGARIAVPGVRVITWCDDPTVAPRVTDGRERPVGSALALVMHTSRGRRSVVRDGLQNIVRIENGNVCYWPNHRLRTIRRGCGATARATASGGGALTR